eukprot:1158820-Pelagomonas_calceolata.AAC.1
MVLPTIVGSQRNWEGEGEGSGRLAPLRVSRSKGSNRGVHAHLPLAVEQAGVKGAAEECMLTAPCSRACLPNLGWLAMFVQIAAAVEKCSRAACARWWQPVMLPTARSVCVCHKILQQWRSGSSRRACACWWPSSTLPAIAAAVEAQEAAEERAAAAEAGRAQADAARKEADKLRWEAQVGASKTGQVKASTAHQEAGKRHWEAKVGFIWFSWVKWVVANAVARK